MMRGLLLALGIFGQAAAAQPAWEEPPTPVQLEAQVHAAPAEVWHALTTREGVLGFFASDARIEPRIGGPYELNFLPDNPPGLRGSEDVRILALEAPSRLLVSWNAPTGFGPLREQQTVVEFLLAPAGQGETRLALRHSGWGRGARWQAVRDYFARAWPHVLGRLQYRFDHGPVDWREPPDGAAYFRPAQSR
jgi:uncharacterized protein YndB with AHSA1/START domain